MNLQLLIAIFGLLDGKYDETFFLQRGMPYKYVEKIKNISKKILQQNKKKSNILIVIPCLREQENNSKVWMRYACKK